MDKLAIALDFDAEDLATNRAGKFSARQAAKLEQAQARSMPILWGICSFTVVLLLIGLAMGGISLVFMSLFVLIGVAITFMEYLLGFLSYRRDLNSGVQSVQGQLHFLQPKDAILSMIDREPDGIRVGDVSFLLLEHQVTAFHEGDIYILYYAPHTNSLLAAERIMGYDRLSEFDDIDYINEQAINHAEIANW